MHSTPIHVEFSFLILSCLVWCPCTAINRSSGSWEIRHTLICVLLAVVLSLRICSSCFYYKNTVVGTIYYSLQKIIFTFFISFVFLSSIYSSFMAELMMFWLWFVENKDKIKKWGWKWKGRKNLVVSSKFVQKVHFCPYILHFISFRCL